MACLHSGGTKKGHCLLVEPESQRIAPLIVKDAPNILDARVTSDRDLIAALGPANNPHLALVRRSTGIVEPLSGVAGPARYPAIFGDGKRLAFSRRKWGAWQLVVRDLATGGEQQLTHTACNATMPSWEDANALLYATDCGRGFGLTAIARVAVQNQATALELAGSHCTVASLCGVRWKFSRWSLGVAFTFLVCCFREFVSRHAFPALF